MAIQVISVNCPACGAEINIESDRESAFCTYCGSKIVINNSNEHIYRNIDEARIKEAETDRMIRLKELEMEEKSSMPKKYLIMAWIAGTAILIVMGVIGLSIDNDGLGICMLLGMCVGMWGGFGLFIANKNKKPQRYAGENEAVITAAMEDYSEKDFNNVVMLFRGAGFTNVTAVPMNDLTMFSQKRNGHVDDVTINGSNEFEEGDVFSKKSNVLITYHSR